MPSFTGHRALLSGLAVVALIAAGVAGALIGNAINSPSNTTPSAQADRSSCDTRRIAAGDLPSVVTVFARGSQSSGVGSGEIIRANGYILTNNHVVMPAVDGGQLQVTFDDGSMTKATITGRDPLTDLAVIHVEGKSDLPAIALGSSANLRVGVGAVALGAPLGLSSTVTKGIVSALGRTVRVPGEGSQPALLVDAVQTDAAINPGNSGGALVNCAGRLIGVPSAGANIPSSSGESGGGGNIGLGFAIPVDPAMKIAKEIISTGKVTHSFIGLQIAPLADDTTGDSGSQGLRIAALTPGGPAAGARLQVGDIITSIDGRAATSADDLMAVMLTRRAGDHVKVGYRRNGSEHTATLTLAALPRG